jgi:hypothetical protein
MKKNDTAAAITATVTGTAELQQLLLLLLLLLLLPQYSDCYSIQKAAPLQVVTHRGPLDALRDVVQRFRLQP